MDAPFPGRFRAGLIAAIRLFLALVFITYGVVKLLGGQFYYGDWTMAKATVDGPSLVWNFYGYSPLYGRMIGLFELVPGLLLLFKRTTALAAGALFAVSLNITIMDFAFGFPSVKYLAAIYTALCGVLILDEAGKWRLMLLTRPEAAMAAEAARRSAASVQEPRRRVSRAAWTALGLVGVPLVAFALNLVATALDSGPEGPAFDAAVRLGYRREDLELRRSRYTGLFGVNRTARVEIGHKGGPFPIIIVEATQSTGFTAWKIGRVAVDSSAGPVR
jgi:hypothetical protein